jgi:hypothetical protein
LFVFGDDFFRQPLDILFYGVVHGLIVVIGPLTEGARFWIEIAVFYYGFGFAG